MEISLKCPYCEQDLFEQEERCYEFLSCENCNLFFGLDGNKMKVATVQQKINSELRRKNILFHANSPPPELDDIDMEDFEDDYLSTEEFNDLIC